MLGEMLQDLGYNTTISHSGHEALDLIQRRDFDVLLSDYRMPVMNGQEFYHAVREEKPDLARRIIFLSGDTVNRDTQTFLRSTGNPHLDKPFDLNQIQHLVASVSLGWTTTCVERS